MTARIFSAVAFTALVSLSACRAPEPAPPPRITRFSADLNEISSGSSVTLTYEVERATEVSLIDDSGASIPLEGDANGGEASVAPTATRFYLLRASNQDGESTAFVQVSVGEPLKEVFLIAAPRTIAPGESAQLLWSAPRHKAARITAGAGEVHNLSGDSGSLVVKPSQTTSYSLIADPGTGAPELTASVQVQVTPKISTFSVDPGAAHAGETMTLRWSTAGGTALMITERTFGQVFDSGELAEVASGTYDFALPTTMPNGTPVRDGLPLEFVLRVVGGAPDTEATAKRTAHVGSPPMVSSFSVPQYVTVGRPFTASWKTSDAEKVEIFADGLRVFASLPGARAIVDEGSAQLPAPSTAATYELVATNALGVATRSASTVTAFAVPQIASLTVPSSLAAGPGGVVSWTTQGASRVTLRLHDGPNVYVTSDPAKVAAGSVSLSFGTPVRLTLEAMNAAGAVVHRTSELIPGSAMGTSTAPASTVADVPLSVSWDAGALVPARLDGVPNETPEVSSNAAAFVDLLQQPLATELAFKDVNDAVSTVQPGLGFRFPFFGRTHERFDVQIDGVVGLTEQLPSKSHTALPAMMLGSALAPFWDELDLGANGKVHWYLDGADFPRRLIIQWSNLERSTAAGATQLTFQVQLYESGAFKFIYGTLTGPGADGEAATIGAQSFANRWHAERPPTSPSPKVSAGVELNWFSSPQSAGSVLASFSAPTGVPVLGVDSVGRTIVGEVKVRAFTPGSVAVTEVMAQPEATLTSGRWVEVENRSRTAINLDGLVLSASGSTAGFPLPAVELQPDEVLVVGETVDPALSGDANVQYVWSDVPLAVPADEVRLVVANGVVSSFAYSVPPNGAGRSLYGPQQDAIEGVPGPDGGVAIPLQCAGNETFGSSVTSYGTPGVANARCLPYRVERIPSRFEDVAEPRTRIYEPSRYMPTFTNQVVEYPLDAGFTYFGQKYFKAWVSTNGFISFGTALDQPVNRTAPSSIADAQGMIAPFWDDFDYFPHTPAGLYAQRSSDHWTFQWSGVAHAPYTADLINAEAKLFDDGTIEFHYGALTNATSAALAFGSSATAWCEMPGKAKAMAISRNQPLLLPYTAYRFVPVP